MIITCPSCESQYILPDDAIGAKGRRVKCTSCAYTWLQAPVSEDTDVIEAKEFSFDPPIESTEIVQETFKETSVTRDIFDPRREVPVVSTPWGRIVGTGAALGVLLAVLSLVFLVVIRPGITPSWPPLALLYERIGFAVPAPGTGLTFKDVKVAFEGEEKPLLRIEGTISNPTDTDKMLPDLLVRLSGETGWLKDWPIELYGKTLRAGEDAGFRYTLENAPQGGQEVLLRFNE